MSWSDFFALLKQFFSWVKSPVVSMCILLIFLIIVGVVLFRNKEVRAELLLFFEPLSVSAKRLFILFLIVLSFSVVVFFSLCFKIELLSHENVYLFIGLAFTSFFGVIIALKSSTNNIDELLYGISEMLDNVPDNDEMYFILPTPFLGYSHYQGVYKKINAYLMDAPKYHLAFLDWHSKEAVQSILTTLEDKFKIQVDSYHNVNSDKKLTDDQIELNAKRDSWIHFVSKVDAKRTVKKTVKKGELFLPDLFLFHLDEILQASLPDHERYDYFVGICKFMINLLKRSEITQDIELRQIAVPYNYFETVFPIILINHFGHILHGTTRVESQYKVRFEGDIINDNTLSKKAQTMFDAYCK